MVCPAHGGGPPSVPAGGPPLFSSVIVTVPFAGGDVIFTTTCSATQSLLRALCSATSVFTPDGTEADSGAAMADAEATTARTEHRANIRMSPPVNRCHPDAIAQLFRI